MRISTPATHNLTFTEQINCFELCANGFATNLICIARGKKLILGLIRFPEESDTNKFSWERLKDIYHDSRCHAITFSPETSLVTFPKPNIIFCAAGADFNLRIFRTDLSDAGTVQVLKGHTNYINDIAWDLKGLHLASVSDDHSCKIWLSQSDYKETITFCLSSAGMSVKWHAAEPNKVLVAEKKGIIHFYNVHSQRAIFSVETPGCGVLMSADWSLNNRLYVTALAAGEIITWDLRRTCRPADIKQAHEDGGRTVKFAPSNECVIASVGRPDFTLKVFTAKSNVPIIEAPLKLYGNNCMSWHYRLPYVAVAEDRNLSFWKVQIK